MKQENNAGRRIGLGRNWIDQAEKTPDEPPVKVRSGTNVAVGRMIGGAHQPRAFVWVDEAANDPKREIVICPDLEGNWLWENGQATDAEAAFPGNKEVHRLAGKFEYWLKYLKEHWTSNRSQRFFWGRFHDEGTGIARKLQAMVIEEAIVRYWRPAQDPRSATDREIRL